jgi:cytochrome b pre-mRNA-processing protein 3
MTASLETQAPMDKQTMAFARLKQLWGGTPGKKMRPLYASLIGLARDPVLFADGQVPDTIDGRFEALSLTTALALLRLEALGESEGGEPARAAAAELTECFVADMDSQMREIGLGDVVVGKHVGKMMSALGGRLTGLRAASEGGDEAALSAFVVRTLYAGAAPERDALAATMAHLGTIRARLDRTALDPLLAGAIAA